MRLPIRIYFEDTDSGGVVYYANYLKYFERGRTELLREKGVSLPELHSSGIIFVVTKVNVEYLCPCRYDDLLPLETRVAASSRATITFEHVIRKDSSAKEHVRGTVVLAAVGRDLKPVGIPEGIKRLLSTAR